MAVGIMIARLVVAANAVYLPVVTKSSPGLVK
jgi:hypothetical protein